MTAVTCPGLPGDWINGWLAAVGATVLDSRLRLHWTTGGTPLAVLSAHGANPASSLAERWPGRDVLDALPLAKNWMGTPEIARVVAVDDFDARVRAARGDPYSWTLSSTMTDLDVAKDGTVAHAPFDPAGPGPVKWLHHRLIRLSEAVRVSPGRLDRSLKGEAQRIKNNGLGFDLTRMGSQADGSGKWVDPVIEILVFFGLALLPVRGAGTDARLSRSARSSAIQRGWVREAKGHPRFRWPAWSPLLGRDGIDALLDLWQPTKKKTWRSVGVHAGWQTVQFKRTARADTTRGFGSARL